MEKRPPHDPAHYWRLAAERMEAEQLDRLRSMSPADGLRALVRLTQGTRLRRDNRIERDSEMLLLAELFQRAYAERKGAPQ